MDHDIIFIACAGPGAHDLLKISLKARANDANAAPLQQRTMLLPFVKDFVPMIDQEKQAVFISPPPGLLELAMTPASKGKGKRKKAPANATSKELEGDNAVL